MCLFSIQRVPTCVWCLLRWRVVLWGSVRRETFKRAAIIYFSLPPLCTPTLTKEWYVWSVVILSMKLSKFSHQETSVFYAVYNLIPNPTCLKINSLRWNFLIMIHYYSSRSDVDKSQTNMLSMIWSWKWWISSFIVLPSIVTSSLIFPISIIT